MIEEKSQKFLRIQNLVLIIGIAIFIGGILVIFNGLDERIKSLEETVNQFTLEEGKIVPIEGISGTGEEIKKEEEEETLKTWNEVATFNGVESQKTDSFSVPTEEWKMKWELERYPQKIGQFAVKILQEKDNALLDSLSRSILPGEGIYSESFFYYQGEEKFYFDVTANDLNNWKIKVYELEEK